MLEAFGEDHLAELFREHVTMAGVTRADLHGSTKTHVQSNFRSWRDSGITWLVLREMTEGDAENLFSLGQNPNVTRYIPGEAPLTSAEGALAVLRERVFPQYARKLGRWACIEKASGNFLGWSGVKWEEEDHEYDIGYRFLERYWGFGYATESARAVLGYARAKLAGERVVGKAMLENRASIRTLEKIGLVFEGTVDDHGCLWSVYVMK